MREVGRVNILSQRWRDDDDEEEEKEKRRKGFCFLVKVPLVLPSGGELDFQLAILVLVVPTKSYYQNFCYNRDCIVL